MSWGFLDQIQVVTQPLDERAGDGDRAFQAVNGRIVADLVSKRGQQAALGLDRLGAGVEQHEAARPVGVLGLAGAEARLAYQGSLLVAQIAAYRDLVAKRPTLRGLAPCLRIAGGHDPGQHRSWYSHNAEDLVIPIQGFQVHQHGSGSIRNVGDVGAAVRAARQPPDHPGVDIAEERIAAFCCGAHAINILQDPFDLRA